MNVGDSIFLLTNDDILVYHVDFQLMPGSYGVTYQYSLMRTRFPPSPIQDVLYLNESRDYKLIYQPNADVIIIHNNMDRASQKKCQRLYLRYKRICPNDMFNFKVAPDLSLDQYSELVDELTLCRNLRIEEAFRCGGADPGHLLAIFQAHRNQKMAVGIYRAKKLSQQIIERWSGKEEIIQRLADLPRRVLVRNILQTDPDVTTILFPGRSIKDLNQIELGAIVLYLEERGTGILRRIFEPTELSPEIRKILNRWSEEDETPHRIVERLLQVPDDRLIRAILQEDPTVIRRFFGNRDISELSRPELAAMILYLEGESTTGGPLWPLIDRM